MMEWMDTELQRPENNQKLLMSYNGLVMNGRFANGKFYYEISCAHIPGYCKCEEQEGITHWMPLPPPPKKKHLCKPLPSPPKKKHLCKVDDWTCGLNIHGELTLRAGVFNDFCLRSIPVNFCPFCGEKA